MANKGFQDQPHLHTKSEHRAALLTYPANLQEAIRQAQEDPKKTMFGVAQGIPSVFVTKVFASTQPDFIWMDAEHAIYDRSTLYDAIHAAQHHSEGKTMVVVRVPQHDEISLSAALDAGASGIIFPHMESAEDVRQMIKKCYYPPIGQRSFSPWTFTPGISDASLYANDTFNMKTANNHVCIIPQVESVKGLENIDEIASMPEVSALMFGPGDFSADAGIELKLDGEPDPAFMAAMTEFVTAAKKHGKPLFGGAQSPNMVPMMIQQGYTAIAVAFDLWGMANLARDGVQSARAIVQKEDEASGKDSGAAENGSTEGTKDTTEVVNGKAPPS